MPDVAVACDIQVMLEEQGFPARTHAGNLMKQTKNPFKMKRLFSKWKGLLQQIKNSRGKVFLFVDVILFKLSVKCGEADPQKFGGLGLIAFGITQYLFYMILFNGRQGQAFRSRPVFFLNFKWQVFGQDFARL